jgi:hypothetical protein
MLVELQAVTGAVSVGAMVTHPSAALPRFSLQTALPATQVVATGTGVSSRQVATTELVLTSASATTTFASSPTRSTPAMPVEIHRWAKTVCVPTFQALTVLGVRWEPGTPATFGMLLASSSRIRRS